MRTEGAISGGAAAARGCLIEGGSAVFQLYWVFQLSSMRTGISMATSAADRKPKRRVSVQRMAVLASKLETGRKGAFRSDAG